MEEPVVEKKTLQPTPRTPTPKKTTKPPQLPKSTESSRNNSNHSIKTTSTAKTNQTPTRNNSNPSPRRIAIPPTSTLPKKTLNSTPNNTTATKKPPSPTKTIKTTPTTMAKTPPEKVSPPATATNSTSSSKPEKSREEILAEREAKRLAKAAAKNKSKLPTENSAAPVIPPTPAPTSAPAQIPNETVNNAIDTKTEKSREDIKAEREAKKLAKQMAKSKAKGGDTVPAGATDQKAAVEKQVSVTELANKLDHIHISEKKEKPATSKAERRAIQEAQRQAKAKLLAEKQSKQPTPAAEKPIKAASPPKTVKAKNGTASPSESPQKTEQYKIKLFNHLSTTTKEHNLFINNSTIHPAVVRLGEQYAKRTIVGSNARCIAFINAMKKVIQDYETPPKKEFGRGLEASIKNCVDHLHKCRPLAVSIHNAHKYIKFILTQLPTDQPDSDLKEGLSELLDNYKSDQIDKAAQAISYSVQEKISNGDVILTFGCSSLINHILEEAHRRNVDFRVILVDSRPFLEGQELLRRLVSKGISCTCVLINAVSFILPEVTKVLLGAHALLANGYVMARTGTAQIALLARSFNVPVLVCCETHKFSERVQTDAIVYNELGNPGDLVSRRNGKDNPLENWQNFQKLYPLNLIYDITPPELVTAVVTEVAILPCTSVPVILRIKPTEILY